MQRIIVSVPWNLRPGQAERLREYVSSWLRGETPILLLEGGITAQMVDLTDLPQVSVEEKLNKLQATKFQEMLDKFRSIAEGSKPITVKAEE